jgi:type IV pilus assembly protein PilE
MNIRQQTNCSRESGFSLIELLVTLTIVSILATIATPLFSEYFQRGKLSQGLATLTQLAVQMEKSYLDYRRYDDNGTCLVTAPSDDYFDYSCESAGQNYLWLATTKDGQYSYSINQDNQRKTELYDGSSSTAEDCWQLSADGRCY